MKIKKSIYSTAWNVIEKKFDYKGALDNWAYYADEISVAIPKRECGCNDDTLGAIRAYSEERGYPVSIIETEFDFNTDPFAYGKTENAALQNCTGEFLIQQNLDERLGGDKKLLNDLSEHLLRTPFIDSYYVPVINLYGSIDKFIDIAGKWYIHKRGFFRGPVAFGIKPDGRPDYNKTSTDELISEKGTLTRSYPLTREPKIEPIREYIKAGMPIVYHLGYLSLNDRLDRSIWWKNFWVNATNGDKNEHPSSIEELAKENTQDHGIPHPLWPNYERPAQNTQDSKQA